MPRTRRYIEPGRPYELILRVREGLPFRPGPLINTLLEGIMARAQRDNKVTICHYLWMSNHVHMIFIPHDPLSCVNFYQEIQKKITDTFKKLLGKRRLCLWEGDAVLAQILDVRKAVERVAYLYANPARANLVSSIENYPGASSWDAFYHKDEEPKEVPWLQLPTIHKLPSLSLTRKVEEKILSELKVKSVVGHGLQVKPRALIEAFGIETDMRESIIEVIRSKELTAERVRRETKKTVKSRALLMQECINAPHLPKKRLGENRIFVLSSCRELRTSFINAIKIFSARCMNCYQMLRKGIEKIPWPMGAFRPWAPPLNC